MTTNPNSPKVTVREMTDADLPPILDKTAIKAWIDNNGRGPRPTGADAGHYQHIVLNTVTGALYFHCSDHRADNKAPGYYPGALFAPSYWQGVPHVMYWVIDSGVTQLPYLTADQGNALAHQLAPLAQTLLNDLLPVPGTDDLDWSAESASAGLDIDLACDREPKGPQGRRPWLVNLGEAIYPFPELVHASLADATDERLDFEAEHLSRMGLGPHGTHFPNLAEYYEVNQKDAQRFHAGLVGTRAYLHQWRADQSRDRRPVDATRWAVTEARVNLARRVSPDHSDADLEYIAEELQELATKDGVKLLGSVQLLREYRSQARQRLVDELEVFGKARQEAENDLKRYRAAVTGRLAQIMSWDDPTHSRNDAELGRRARLTRQAVNKLRGTFEDVENASMPRDEVELEERIAADYALDDEPAN